MLPVLLLGLVLGFRHAFEPDHLAAVSTLASRRGCATRAGAGTCASTCTKRTRIHLHSHAQNAGHVHLHTADARRSLGFGVAHGLAGSGAIAVLLVAAAPSAGLRLAYFAAFGAGTILGMLSVSLTLGAMVRVASRRGATWATALHLGSAVVSVLAGVVLAQRVLFGT